jgi:tryptophan-rich sensory protein
MFAFMPKRNLHKVAFFIFIVLLGLVFAFTRVGVGAHYPLDVIVGCIVGYISGLLGTFVSKEYKLWAWVYNKKYYPIFIALFLVSAVVLVNRIRTENLVIYYLSFTSLVVSLYKIIATYVKK